jgi:hypothetical protein
VLRLGDLALDHAAREVLLAARRVTIGRPPGGVFKVSTDEVAR